MLKKFKLNKKFVISIIAISVIYVIAFASFYGGVPYFKGLGIYANQTEEKQLIKTVINLIEEELDFAWLPNDFILSPTRLLDNRPNFQEGVLTILRHTSRVLRDNLSRQRTTDAVNKDVGKAFTLLNNDFQKWMFPSFESRLKKTVTHLLNFDTELTEQKTGANYYPRSDNLIQLLDQYISELGSLNNKLLSSDIGFFESDDIFYKVLGTNHALYSLLSSIKNDFKNILIEKKAMALLDETILRLEQSDFSPLMVVKGGRGSLLANHLIQMAGITADARQKLKSINVMLDKN